MTTIAVKIDCDPTTYVEACAVAREIRGNLDGLPPVRAIERGGIIGSVELVDCIEIGTKTPSLPGGNPWFFGRYGFVLRNPQVLPFRRCTGHLGFFDVPDKVAA